MKRNASDYDEPDYEEDPDNSLLDDKEDELEELDFIGDSEHDLDEDDVEISLEIDADGNEIFHAEDAKVPDSHSQGYSAEEAIAGIEQRRREYREMRRRSKQGDDDEEEPDEIPGSDHPVDGDGVNVSLEFDEDGNERWYATDPRVPGSASMGFRAEEAVDGLEDRRSEYRELLRKSRGKSKRKHRKE